MTSRAFFLALLLPLSTLCQGQQNHGYYRFPAIYGTTVVFTSEGDLWQVGTEGGIARRLTSHPGEETRARFSPDGQTLAYSANYEGPTEVYTMPASGGLPARRTFEGGQTAVAGWTADGKVLYRTSHFSTLPDAQLATIDADNRIERIPLSQAAQGVYDAQGKSLFFTRLPFQGSQAKRYKGGSVESLWKYVPGQEAIALTADYTGTSRDPMWWNGRVYFATDRDGTLNVWSMDENGKNLRQHTRHQGWDVNTPALSQGRIVYQLGADLHVYEIASGTDKTLNIEIPSDFDNLREHWIRQPLEYTTSMHLAPDGGSVVLTSRGRVFVVPAKQGRLVEATDQKPARYRNASMMPDGKSLLVLSSESGEVELWKIPASGVGAGERLTTDGQVLRWDATPSPDGKWIAHQDKENRLWLLETATKAQKTIATSESSGNSSPPFQDLAWSPDSKWLLWSTEGANTFGRILLYNVETGVTTPLTSDRYNSGGAFWSPDGKWIYFVSDRALKTLVFSPWGSRQPDPYFDRASKIYELALKKGQRSPFEPADELHPDKSAEPAKPSDSTKTADAAKAADAAKPADTSKPEEPAKAAPVPKVEIDLDGIASRIQEVPAPPGNYGDLTVMAKRLCWMNRDHATPEKSSLECMDIANKGEKPETLIEGVQGYQLSEDRKKILIRKGQDLYIVDSSIKAGPLKDPKTLTDSKVDLKDWTFSVIPSEEFKEALHDAWRLHRDYFYDRNMHGVKWSVMRDKYGELIGRVRDRQELNDLIAQMVSELNVLHNFVVGGDLRRGVDQIQLAALGARLSRDKAAGGYAIEHIYQSDPDRPEKLSPLSRPGVEVVEGDVITEINGRDLLASPDPGELLRNQAGKQVLLRVRAKGGTATRDVVVKPITVQDENDLRYQEWELTRRLQVEKTSGGQIGYVHLRAMGPNDINAWAEQFYPIFDRQGLIVDVRHNGGGNIDSWILSKLLRRAWMYWQPRVGKPTWNMQYAFRGHLVVLCDERTGSDGEAFAEGFRRLGLGKVIGTRTWGGEIWLTGSNVLADRGIATAAEIGVYSPDREWLIEGHGVDPDIPVDNLPHATFEGKDAQLEAAISHLQTLIRQKPNPVPPPPAYPDKSWPARPGGPTTGAH
jgi:tricorn protease